MDKSKSANYEVAGRETVAEGADLRVQVLTLGAGQSVPWHFHTAISDHFVCLEGSVVVETRAPRATHELAPGQRCTVGPKTAHTVYGRGGAPCTFMVIQGVGTYDFVPADG